MTDVAEVSRGLTGVIDPGSGPSEEEIVLPHLYCGPIERLQTFSIRNGDPSEAHSLLIKPSIPAAYHWQTIDGLKKEHHIASTGAYVRQAFVRLNLEKPTGLSEETLRKQAILLGVSRAVTTQLYDITAADLIPGECAEGYLTAKYEDNGDLRILVNKNAPDDAKAMLAQPFALTEQENAVVAAAHMSSIGILALQGYSLIMTGHHYLSEGENQSRRAYKVVERQVWKSQAVSGWWEASANDLQDALWHKSCHPVQISIKRDVAQNPDVPAMLIKAGAGPAAARLPALEPELRMANSYRTLVQTVRPLLESYGGSIGYDLLNNALNAVRLFPGSGKAVDVKEMPNAPSNLPEYVRSRPTALAYLKDVCDRNADQVAVCYGFYCQMAEQSLMTGTETDTLKTSFSLKRLKTQCYAAYIQGTQIYGDYQAARNQARASGTSVAPKLGFL